MKAIVCYLLFIISLVRMSLSDDDAFSEKNKKTFLKKLLDLHNTSREKLELDELEQTKFMNDVARDILRNKLINNMDRVPASLGVNYFSETYDDNTKLDDALAETIYTQWYIKKFINLDPVESKIDTSDGSVEITWDGTKKIGLAVERINNTFAVIALYFPSYKTGSQGKLASNDSKLPTTDQAGPSNI